jgi:hypothetical protein
MRYASELLVVLLAVEGAIVGAVWGWRHYGILGSVLGLPIGAVVGVLSLWLMILAVATVVYAVLMVWAFCRRGPRGLVLLYRHGVDGVARGGPMRGPDEPSRPNETRG